MSTRLQKNQSKPLNAMGVACPILVFAVGWDNDKPGLIGKLMGKQATTDLDLSCAVYDKNNDRIDCVWYAQLKSKDGAIRHKGDDTIGTDNTDDETITLDLNQLKDEAHTVFFVVSAFAGQSMARVNKAYWRLFDGQTKQEIATNDIPAHSSASAKIVMRLQKKDNAGRDEWHITALDEAATGQNIQEVLPEIRALLEA